MYDSFPLSHVLIRAPSPGFAAQIPATKRHGTQRRFEVGDWDACIPFSRLKKSILAHIYMTWITVPVHDVQVGVGNNGQQAALATETVFQQLLCLRYENKQSRSSPPLALSLS